MMPDDDLLARCAANCASAYHTLAQAMDRPANRWDDLWAGDLRLPTPQSPNNATPLRPLRVTELDDVLDRLRRFFTGQGGGYQLWSAWPTPDLSSAGFQTFSCPAMVLAAGSEPRPAPDGLRVVEVEDLVTLAHAEALWNESFEIGAEPGTMVDERALRAWRLWVGYVDDRPVASAAAHESDGLIGIYAVATTPDARGHGFGEALTWAAVRSRPDLPAALQASPMGRPVYGRMGFEQVGTFTVWERPAR
jgi:GNAT superfamily N-acetyltransferase